MKPLAILLLAILCIGAGRYLQWHDLLVDRNAFNHGAGWALIWLQSNMQSKTITINVTNHEDCYRFFFDPVWATYTNHAAKTLK